MVILGTGVDLCQQSRIAACLARFRDRFRHRVFSVSEQHQAERVPMRRIARYSQMFAAKEACAKALGTGFRQGVFWRNMELVPLPSGKPTLRFSGGALERLNALTPLEWEAKIEISLTDENGMALASVMIWAAPPDSLRQLPNLQLPKHR